jgi:hypothetical protein
VQDVAPLQSVSDSAPRIVRSGFVSDYDMSKLTYATLNAGRYCPSGQYGSNHVQVNLLTDSNGLDPRASRPQLGGC